MLTPRLFFFFWLDGHAPDVKKSAAAGPTPVASRGAMERYVMPSQLSLNSDSQQGKVEKSI
jgi:hypothetical protein